MQPTTARVLGPGDGEAGMLGSMGVRFMIDGGETGGGFSLVEHPIPPRALAAPLHRHTHEDEYSFVLEGRVGALLGDEVVHGTPGTYVLAPPNVVHWFRNLSDEPVRMLNLHTPGGFAQYRRELRELRAQGIEPDREFFERHDVFDV